MRTIYIDSDFKCHISDDGTMKAVETDYFDGKCDTFVEGHCYEDLGNGVVIYPWKDSSDLYFAQMKFERQKLKEYEALIDDLYAEVTS